MHVLMMNSTTTLDPTTSKFLVNFALYFSDGYSMGEEIYLEEGDTSVSIRNRIIDKLNTETDRMGIPRIPSENVLITVPRNGTEL